MKKLGYPIAVALGFITLGFLALGIAWDGAASVDFPEGQIPYLLSGGAVGIGLIILGAGLIMFEAGRRVTSRLEERLEALTEVLAGGATVAKKDDEPAQERLSLNGRVVVGRSSFHTPDCRLVTGKEDLEFASPDEAVERGLNACRVCDPLGQYASSKR